MKYKPYPGFVFERQTPPDNLKSLCQRSVLSIGRVYGFFNCPAIKARVLTNRVTQAGSQWIEAQRPLSHLQFLGATKSSAKDLPLPGLEIASDSSSL